MSYTAADMESAIEKLSALDFTDAELAAIAAVLEDTGEVEGFGRKPPSSGHETLRDLAERLAKTRTSVSGLGLGSGRVVLEKGSP